MKMIEEPPKTRRRKKLNVEEILEGVPPDQLTEGHIFEATFLVTVLDRADNQQMNQIDLVRKAFADKRSEKGANRAIHAMLGCTKTRYPQRLPMRWAYLLAQALGMSFLDVAAEAYHVMRTLEIFKRLTGSQA